MRIRYLLAAATLLFLPAAALAVVPVLGPQIQVNVSTRNVQGAPKAAVFPDGGFVVVWEARARTGPGRNRGVLHARLFDENGSPATGEFLLTATAGVAPALDGVAADGNGAFAIAWDQAEGSPSGMTEVYVQRFDRAGRPLTGAVLAPDPSPFSRYSGALAVGANGHVAVIWAADASSPDALNYRNDAYARIFSAGLVPLSGELLVAMGSDTDHSGPSPTPSPWRATTRWWRRSPMPATASPSSCKGSRPTARRSPRTPSSPRPSAASPTPTTRPWPWPPTGASRSSGITTLPPTPRGCRCRSLPRQASPEDSILPRAWPRATPTCRSTGAGSERSPRPWWHGCPAAVSPPPGSTNQGATAPARGSSAASSPPTAPPSAATS